LGVRVVTYNLHAGVDGYGRANDVVDSAVALAPDLLFAQEVWRGAHDQFTALTERLGLTGEFVQLGVGDRVTAAVGGRGWQSPLALVRGEEGLYFDERREITRHQRTRRLAAPGREAGVWGLALLTNLAIEDVHVEYLDQLARDKVRRAVIVARLHDGERPLVAVAVHGAHLTHGSLRQFRQVAHRLDQIEPTTPVVVGGDFNCWRPLLRTVFPRWRTGVRAKTWPAWRPHSQIDHLLLRGEWSVTHRDSVRGPSDHRALVLDATLGVSR
jgi:endonuclease/exonuclease/phosphatase family metal-dependent hydrolase